VKLQHKFRASSLAEIMSDPTSIDASLLSPELLTISKKKTKTDEDKAVLAPYWDMSLSAGAKTTCERLAKQFVYGYDSVMTSKYTEKGTQVEDQSIALRNQVFFTNYKKNTERRTNEWITGECDLIIPGNRVIDIKSSWSLDTFPATSKAGEDKTYEWQGRAYMWLWDVPEFEINYCLVNTPDELIGYEDTALHYVDHIEPELRVTRVVYRRDLALEQKIKTKVEAAQKLMNALIDQIANEHSY
jgi:hypothetical protein